MQLHWIHHHYECCRFLFCLLAPILTSLLTAWKRSTTQPWNRTAISHSAFIPLHHNLPKLLFPFCPSPKPPSKPHFYHNSKGNSHNFFGDSVTQKLPSPVNSTFGNFDLVRGPFASFRALRFLHSNWRPISWHVQPNNLYFITTQSFSIFKNSGEGSLHEHGAHFKWENYTPP